MSLTLPSSSPVTYFLFISSLCCKLQQLFFLNLILLSHDEPRGILVLYSNSLVLSDPSIISYFLSSPFTPLTPFCLFPLFHSEFHPNPPRRLSRAVGQQVICIAHHRRSACVCESVSAAVSASLEYKKPQEDRGVNLSRE